MLCDYCEFKSECEYYEETICAIRKAILHGGDEFSYRVRLALDEFTCGEYKENENE